MQRNKITKKISELEAIASDSETLTSSLTQVIGNFNGRANFRVFDFLKSKGLAVSSLLNVLLILPFYKPCQRTALANCAETPMAYDRLLAFGILLF